jgi:hypothetical protein
MTRFYIIVLLFVPMATAIAADSSIMCRAQKPTNHSEWWAYRIIDGKQCWYPGRPGMAKSLLRWEQKIPVNTMVEPDFNACCWGWPLK